MNEDSRSAWGIAFLLAGIAVVVDVLAWLGPRRCPLCDGRRSGRERVRGYHDCRAERARAAA